VCTAHEGLANGLMYEGREVYCGLIMSTALGGRHELSYWAGCGAVAAAGC
jgi:hypothetical protein